MNDQWTTKTVIYPKLSTTLICLALGLPVPPALVTIYDSRRLTAYRYAAHV